MVPSSYARHCWLRQRQLQVSGIPSGGMLWQLAQPAPRQQRSFRALGPGQRPTICSAMSRSVSHGSTGCGIWRSVSFHRALAPLSRCALRSVRKRL